MTDKEKLVALFDEFGIGYEFESDRYDPSDGETPNGIVLENPMDEDDKEKIVGYGGFYARFNFDDNGKFVCVGIWE